MSTTMHFRKGKGPFRNGNSHAEKYSNLVREVTELCQRNDPRALRDLGGIADTMGGILNRHPSSIAKLGDGFRINVSKRDIGPDDFTGTTLLSNLSVQYASPDLIGMELMPIAPVDLPSGSYPIVNRSDRLQPVRGRGLGRRSRANEIPITESEGTYSTMPYAHKGVIGLDSVLAGNIAARRAPINRLTRVVDDVGFHHQLEHEVEVVALLTDPANYGANNQLALTSGNHWDEADAIIAADTDAAKLKIKNGRGTTELIGWTTTPIWNVIKKNTALVGLMSANDRGFITEEMFMEIMGLDGLLISELVLNEANIAETPDLQYTWGNNFGIVRVSRTPAMLNASYGYTFRWNINSGMPADSMMVGAEGVLTRMWFEPDEGPFGSFMYKVASQWGLGTVDVDLAYLYSDVLADFPDGA